MYHVERGPWLSPNGVESSFPSFIRTLAKPDSVRRLKPEDLFYDVTDRTTSSSESINAIYKPFSWSDQEDVLSCGAEQTFDWIYLEERARGKLLDAIKNQNVNLAQMSAEYRSSAKLFRSLAGELYQGYKAIRRGHLGAAIRDLSRDRGFARKWIEFQFGLVPVVMDLEGVCLSLADNLREGHTRYVTIRTKDTQRYERRYLDPIGTGWLLHEEVETLLIKLRARWVVGDHLLDDISRFGFSNVPALLWELVPFSFVVDWAIGVGDWLSRLDALIGAKDLIYAPSYRYQWSASTSHESGVTAFSSTDTRARGLSQTNLVNPFPRYKPSQSLKSVVTGLALLRLLSR